MELIDPGGTPPNTSDARRHVNSPLRVYWCPFAVFDTPSHMKKYVMIGLMGLFIGRGLTAELDWGRLEQAASRMTTDRFSELLSQVYSPDGGIIDYLEYDGATVRVYSSTAHTSAPLSVLRFGDEDAAPYRLPVSDDPALPLKGWKIALDPGHIGGAWAWMEERFFYVNRSDWAVQEGAMNLYVARLLKPELEAMGAEVCLVRDQLEPVTDLRAGDFIEQAKEEVGATGDIRFPDMPDLFRTAVTADAVRRRSEMRFYRTAEIAARADKINQEIQPHLTLCIHFNATGYGDERTLYDENGLAIFVYGNVLQGELASDEQKYFMLSKLFEQSHDAEVQVAQGMQKSWRAIAGLKPAYRAQGGNMVPVDEAFYIYTRNLAANRQFRGPVVFLEPYFMNNRTVYQRIQAGDYEGERVFGNQWLPSIFREYVAAVKAGLLESLNLPVQQSDSDREGHSDE